MIDVVFAAIILSLPVMIAFDKGRLKISILIFLIVFAPIGFHIIFGAPQGIEWVLLLFKIISWLIAFRLALNCNRVSDID
jgi:hypothetical protein